MLQKRQRILPDYLQTILQAEFLRLALQCRRRLRLDFAQTDRWRVSRCRFKTQRSATGKQIQHRKAAQILSQPVKQPLAHAIGSWAQAGGIGENKLPAATAAADNADAVTVLGVVFFGFLAGHFRLLSAIVIKRSDGIIVKAPTLCPPFQAA